MPNVLLRGWQRPVQKIPLVKRLQTESGLSLSEAKRTVDTILEREPVTLVVSSEALAVLLAAAIARLGVSVGE